MFKRYTFLFLFFIGLSSIGWGQTTVFTDDFNRAALTTSAPTTYSPTLATGATASIVSSTYLRINNGSTNGTSYVSGLLSSFDDPFVSTLTDNTGLVTWTFNLKQSRTNPAGTTSGSYGAAIVLAGTLGTLTEGNGYAIVFGNSNTPDPIKLVSYTGGVDGTLTDMIKNSSEDLNPRTNYASVKVTFDPSNDQWKLYVRDDGNSGWSDPTSTSSLIGTLTNSTYTSSSMTAFGFYWSHATSSGEGANYDNFKVTVIGAGATPPTLTADATSNTVDNSIDITFTDDATWRAAITAVKIGGTALTVTTDYVITAGNLQLIPSGPSLLLRTSGTKAVTIEATGYNIASVSQVINAGVPTSNSTATISASLSLGATRTVTATAKDQYNNLVPDYTFKYDATITDANATTDETYTIGGNMVNDDVSGANFGSTTDESGLATLTVQLPTTIDGFDGISVQVRLNNGTTPVGSANSYIQQLSTPTLTADNTLNDVDHDIDISFTDDATWRAAITAVKIGGTALSVTTDYEITSGNLQLKPSGLNALLTSSGTKAVTIEATGYNIATVTQQIDAGAPTANSTSAINLNLALNTTRTVTVTAKDQYNNLVSGYTFKYDATITNANATTDESYTIDGTGRTATVTDIDVVNTTNASGVSTFTIAIPAVVDANDGISIQVQLADGLTNIGTAFSFTKQAVQIMISHLSVDYGGPSDELVVLFNNTSSDFDLNGYQLQYFSSSGGSGATTTFSSSTIIPSKKYRLLSPNATVTVGSISVNKDGNLTSGMGTSGQIVLRETSTPANILYACAWGTITSYVAGMTDAAAWSGDGMISLSPSGTTYIRNEYNTSNTQYSHTLSANITHIPSGADGPLPVELTSFTASAKGTSVILNWETKTEVDNNGFEVERNSTGTWQKIGFVEGHGTANSPKYYSFSDNTALGNKIQYRLKQIDNDGTFEYSPTVEVELNPTQFALYQNYPNPFNPSTIIRYSMPVGGNVSIEVYNTLGEKITSLVNSQVEAGYHEVSFDATNLPSGLYFYKINTDGYTSVKKMLLMK